MEFGYYKNLAMPSAYYQNYEKSYYGGIPQTAIKDFKQTLHQGDQMVMRMPKPFLSSYIYTQASGKTQTNLVTVDIATLYPNFVYTTDRKAYLYIDLMIYSGWWINNKYKYEA